MNININGFNKLPPMAVVPPRVVPKPEVPPSPVPNPVFVCPPNNPPPVVVPVLEPNNPPDPSDVLVPKPPRVDPNPEVPDGLKLNAGFDVAVDPNNPVAPVVPNVFPPNVDVPELVVPKVNGLDVAPNRPPDLNWRKK